MSNAENLHERLKELEENGRILCKGAFEVNKKLQQQLKEANEALTKIDNWNDDMSTFDPEINKIITEYQAKYLEEK